MVTYLTRIGGHLVLSRFERLDPRIDAGLNSVPAAVLTAMVVPAAVANGGLTEWTALAVAGVVALRFGVTLMFLCGAAVLVLSYCAG